MPLLVPLLVNAVLPMRLRGLYAMHHCERYGCNVDSREEAIVTIAITIENRLVRKVV